MARVLGLILLLGLSSARGQDVPSVLAQYVAWRGGPAFEALQSFHEQGTVEQGGLHGKFEQWLSRDGHLRRNDTLGPTSNSQAVTPAGGWRTNVSGQIEDLGGDDAARARYTMLLAFSDAGLAHGAHYSLLGSEAREGRTWTVVRVEFASPDTYDLFIAAGTGELLGERITEDRQTRFVRFGDWRFVRGVRLPFTQVQTGVSAADRQEQHTGRIQLGVGVSEALFARPAGVKIWAFAPGETATAWIDFEYFRERQIFIPGVLNGRPVKLLLDSGASITVVDSAYAKEIKLRATGTLPVMGAGGETTMQLAENLRIQVGSLSLQHIVAGIIDMSGTAAALAHPIPLIIGREVFDQLLVDIDFPHHKLAFRDPQHYSAPQEATRVALGHHDNLRTVDMAIEDGPTVPFDFDLGNTGPLIVYSSYRDKYHVLDGRRQSVWLAGGVGGFNKTKIATVKSVSLGGVTFVQVPADFPDAMDSAENSDRTAGNVGLPVFSRFHLVTDYPHDALWLTAESEWVSQPFPKNRSGLVVVPGGERLRVLLVAPGGPAERAGWKDGAEIVAVDGHKIDADYSSSVWSRWAERPAGTVVELTMGDGSVRQLTLEDYF